MNSAQIILEFNLQLIINLEMFIKEKFKMRALSTMLLVVVFSWSVAAQNQIVNPEECRTCVDSGYDFCLQPNQKEG